MVVLTRTRLHSKRMAQQSEHTNAPKTQKRSYTPAPAVSAEYSHKLAYRLRSLRNARGLTQEKVAAMAHIAPFTYQKYERSAPKEGEAPENPTLGCLLAIAEVFEIDITELLPVSYDAPLKEEPPEEPDEDNWFGKH